MSHRQMVVGKDAFALCFKMFVSQKTNDVSSN
jgi:hypothetical protein